MPIGILYHSKRITGSRRKINRYTELLPNVPYITHTIISWIMMAYDGLSHGLWWIIAWLMMDYVMNYDGLSHGLWWIISWIMMDYLMNYDGVSHGLWWIISWIMMDYLMDYDGLWCIISWYNDYLMDYDGLSHESWWIMMDYCMAYGLCHELWWIISWLMMDYLMDYDGLSHELWWIISWLMIDYDGLSWIMMDYPTWVVDAVEHASQVLEVVYAAGAKRHEEVERCGDRERCRAHRDRLLRGQLTVRVSTLDDELRRRKQEVLDDFLSEKKNVDVW